MQSYMVKMYIFRTLYSYNTTYWNYRYDAFESFFCVYTCLHASHVIKSASIFMVHIHRVRRVKIGLRCFFFLSTLELSYANAYLRLKWSEIRQQASSTQKNALEKGCSCLFFNPRLQYSNRLTISRPWFSKLIEISRVSPRPPRLIISRIVIVYARGKFANKYLVLEIVRLLSQLRVGLHSLASTAASVPFNI